MNPKVKDLADQAKESVPKGILSPELWIEAYNQKFAELIVRECAQLARDTDLEDVEGGDSQVLRAAKRQILEHFGVEE